jgi:hypothetical protein
MKTLILGLAMVAILISFGGHSAFAQGEKPVTSSDPAANAKTIEKKSGRKKKVEMCAECGRPESECECHDKKKDDRKK